MGLLPPNPVTAGGAAPSIPRPALQSHYLMGRSRTSLSFPCIVFRGLAGLPDSGDNGHR